MTGDRHTIQSLVMRWTGPARDARTPAAQLRLEQRLAAVDWQPPGLPPGAILLVRRLDGLPPLRAHGFPGPAWQVHLHNRLAALLQRAARPRWGPVPADAESVLFESPAEMLACLTRDVLKLGDGLPLPWYWAQAATNDAAHDSAPAPQSAISGAATPGARLAAAWTHHAAFLPAALAHLEPGERLRAVALMDEGAASSVLEALCAAHALYLPPVDSAPEYTRDDAGDSSSIRPVVASRAGWEAWLPPLPDHAAPSAHALLAWCAVLRTAPTLARSAPFARQAAAWLAYRRAQVGTAWDAPIGEPGPARSSIGGEPVARPGSPLAQKKGLPPPFAEAHAAGREWAADDRGAACDVDQPMALSTGPDGTVTEWGGVLFLIHLLRWLDWPDSWPPGLGAWEVVEALALALLAEDAPAALHDPIWAVLAAREGRSPDDPLGAQMDAVPDFRLPAAWLHRYAPSARWQIGGDEQVLRAVDEDRGFGVVEAALHGQPLTRAARREVAAARAAGLEITWTRVDSLPAFDENLPVEGRFSPALGRWLCRAMGFLRWMLGSVLGETSLPPGAPGEVILHRRGMLVTSDTHLDLTLPMNAADVRLRRAGLDHDPGWVPALGCIVLFHYVD